MHDAAAAAIRIEHWTLKGRAFAREFIVVPQGGQQDAAAIEFAGGAGGGLPQIILGREVGEGVVGGSGSGGFA